MSQFELMAVEYASLAFVSPSCSLRPIVIGLLVNMKTKGIVNIKLIFPTAHHHTAYSVCL